MYIPTTKISIHSRIAIDYANSFDHDTCHDILGGGFKDFLFSPLPMEMIQFDEHIFQMG